MMQTDVERPRVRRYEILDRIGQGGMGVVYRALDRLTGSVVAFKHVFERPWMLAFSGGLEDYRLALSQEFRVLSSLRHPNIISVLDYGFDEARHPFFTMELLENSQTIIEAGLRRDFDLRMELLIQALQALVYLHRRGIIHRDLKPDNVRVITGQVKVLDFGLALERQYAEDGEGSRRAGTLAYMAPEILMGQSASKASDLYAMGVIAYELFTGEHPFEILDVSGLINNIINVMPDFDSLDLSDNLKLILRRLLAKAPEDRYADASDLLRLHADLTGRALQYETLSTRESFLQAARFVGRDDELAALNTAFARAVQKNGSSWLVGGESGVGKSRLLDELRTQALVGGALALRGQAIANGGIPYALWRDALRLLCLQTELGELEASVLKSLVPDISMLIGREVADAPELDPKTTQNRLLSVVEELFLRQSQPVVVLLEDLQWADNESLEIVNRLNRQIALHALLLVGTFRDDERPDLPDLLPEMYPLKLHRLTGKGIADLSASMLGDKVGRQRSVIELLERETEGNVFFIVEVVRVLAEEAGQLDRIGQITLPEKVFSEGVKTVMQRRLSQVPHEARQLLNLAAVAGRQVDLRLMGKIAPDADLDRWLTVVDSAAVLEVQDEKWRFTHDKLRESLLASLPEDERRLLHRQIAEAIEILNPNQADKAAVLAYHWRIVGDAAREMRYLVEAGEYAISAGAYKDARALLERALTLYRQFEIRVHQRAHLERLLGRLYMTQGELEAARQHCQQALKLAGYPVPLSKAGFALGLLKQIGWQLLNQTRRSSTRPSRFSSEAVALLRSAVQSSEHLLEVEYHSNRVIGTLYHSVRGLNLVEQIRAEARPDLARFYSTMAAVTALIPLKTQSANYVRLANQALEGINDPDSISWVMLAVGTHDMEAGDWEASVSRLRRCMGLATQMGHTRRWQEGAIQLAVAYNLQGQDDEANEIFQSLYASSLSQNDLQGQAWGLLGQAQIAVQHGHLDDALAFLDECDAIHLQTQNRSNMIWAAGLRVRALLCGGQVEKAQPPVMQLADLYAKTGSAATFLVAGGYGDMAAYYMTCWESESDTFYRRDAQAALKNLNRSARIFAVIKPRALAYQSWFERLSKQPERALKTGQSAIAEAQRMRMPYQQARAHYIQAQHFPAGAPQRDEQLVLAEQLLAQMGTYLELKAGHDRLI